MAEGNTTLPTDSGGVPLLGLWDEVDFWYPRGATVDALLYKKALASGLYLTNGASLDRAKSVAGDAQAATGIIAGAPMLYNGATYDRLENANVHLQALSVVGATTTQTSSAIVNKSWHGVAFYIQVSAGTSLQLTVSISSISGGAFIWTAAAAITGVGLTSYILGPSNITKPAGSGLAEVASVPLPGYNFVFQVLHSNANAATYNLTWVPIP
jgi:hypothetical protein